MGNWSRDSGSRSTDNIQVSYSNEINKVNRVTEEDKVLESSIKINNTKTNTNNKNLNFKINNFTSIKRLLNSNEN